MTRRQPSGFTLLELMIAAALAALIVTVVYGAYRATLDGSRRCRAHLALYHEAVTLSGQLKAQLQACHPFVDPAAPTRPGLVLTRSGSGSAALRFVTSQPLLAAGSATAGLYEVSWQASPDGRQLYCERPFILPDQFLTEPALAGYQPISQSAVQLQLEPLDGRGAVIAAATGPAPCPRAIRIGLTVFDPESPQLSFTIHTLAPIVASPAAAGVIAATLAGDRLP